MYVRLLLLRPSLLAEAEARMKILRNGNKPDTSKLEKSIVRGINNLCVDTAHTILDTLYDDLGTQCASNFALAFSVL